MRLQCCKRSTMAWDICSWQQYQQRHDDINSCCWWGLQRLGKITFLKEEYKRLKPECGKAVESGNWFMGSLRGMIRILLFYFFLWFYQQIMIPINRLVLPSCPHFKLPPFFGSCGITHWYPSSKSCHRNPEEETSSAGVGRRKVGSNHGHGDMPDKMRTSATDYELRMGKKWSANKLCKCAWCANSVVQMTAYTDITLGKGGGRLSTCNFSFPLQSARSIRLTRDEGLKRYGRLRINLGKLNLTIEGRKGWRALIGPNHWR